MRVVKEILRSDCKVTIFQWNGKYLVKFEQDMLEQTYKIDEFDITGEDEILSVVNDTFIKEVALIFRSMHDSLTKYGIS